MLFEIAGFMSGLVVVGAALWRLYTHDRSQVMQSVYGGPPGRPRVPETMP